MMLVERGKTSIRSMQVVRQSLKVLSRSARSGCLVTSPQGCASRTVYGSVYALLEDYRRALERFPAD